MRRRNREGTAVLRQPTSGQGRDQPATEPVSDVDPYAVRWPDLLLTIGIAIHFMVMATLVVSRHNEFWTHDYDLGIFDQAIWLLSRAESFISIRGLSVFGHHANLGFLLLVPFYWLGAGANFLNVLMVGALSAAAIPVYRYASQLLQNTWHGLVLAGAFLLHFTISWMVNETFHPEVLAIPLLMAAYVAATRGHWKSYSAWLVAALIWKEDVALAAMMIGVVLWIRGQRKVGIITVAGAAGWFFFTTRVMIPYFSGGGAFYDGFFGELGSGPIEIAGNAITNPSLVVNALDQHNVVGYLRDLMLPFGFLPLLSPLTLAIGLPQIMVNMLSAHGLSANIRVHYVAMPLAAAALAMVEGVAKLTRPAWRRFGVGLVAALCLSTSAVWSLLPYAADYEGGYWPLGGNDRRHVFEVAVALPEPDAAVAATWNLVSHLSHRRQIYTFPNPWVQSNWGSGVEEPPDPAEIDWLVIDRSVLGVSAPEFDQVLSEESWEIVLDRDDVVVARRTPP